MHEDNEFGRCGRGDIQNSSLFTGPGPYEIPLTIKSSSPPGPCNATYLLARQAGESEEYADSAKIFCKLAEGKISEIMFVFNRLI